MCENNKVEQEWAVFKAICPKPLLDIIETVDISYSDYIKIVNMYHLLGFDELSKDFLVSRFEDLQEDTEKVCKAGMNPAKAKYYKVEYEEYEEKEYIQLFLENIISPSLKDLFQKKVDYFA